MTCAGANGNHWFGLGTDFGGVAKNTAKTRTVSWNRVVLKNSAKTQIVLYNRSVMKSVA